VSATALGLALGAALLHALWNVLLARAPRGHDATAVAVALGWLCWTPLAMLRWRVEPDVWPYVAASVGFELAYFAALTRAYARAPAHAVYPVARGAAPVLLLAASALATGRLAGSAVAAVLAISAGVLLAGRAPAAPAAIRYALPVAVCVAGYMFVDSRGLAHADAAAYLWLVMLPVSAALLANRVVVGRGTAALRASLRPATAAVGLGVFGAYGLTLAALRLVTPAQVPAVASLRESSILFVVVLSWLAGRERPTAAVGAGALLVFAGVVVISAW
jgi:drug/metabolite transporter (DMT)-like permease